MAPRSARILAVTAILLGAAMACSDDGEGTATSTESAAPVIVPGRPGEPARTASPGERPPEIKPNDADVEFVQSMIPHHQQALEMSALVGERTANRLVRGMAGRIEASQAPEIKALQAWLTANGFEEEGHGAHMSMPGMATDQQLTQLRAARGAAFDRLFLQLMITHHQGGGTMAVELLSTGRDVLVHQMASEILATQNAEISRMQAIGAG